MPAVPMASFIVVLLVVGILAIIGLVLYLRSRDRARVKALEAAAHLKAPLSAPPVELSELIPDSLYIEIEDAKFHYVQAGEGSDIVLIHGIGASVYIWRFLFPLLQARHRVTAIDLPGFGKSNKDSTRDYGLDAQTELVARMLALLDLKDPILVGSSMGGAIALWLAHRFPERYKRVVALSPATDYSLVPPTATYLVMAAPLLRRALTRRSMKTLLGRVMSRRQRITDEVVDAYLEPFSDQGQGVKAFWSALKLLADRRLPQGLKGLTARVLVIYGEGDRLVPRRSIERLMRVLPEATLVTHHDGGHHIMEDEPEWTARLIAQFAEKPAAR